jgi:hypothetical protein
MDSSQTVEKGTKGTVEHRENREHAGDNHHDAKGVAVSFEEGMESGLSDAHLCSEEDNKRILRKTDLYMLSLLCMVYFLQSADKG